MIETRKPYTSRDYKERFEFKLTVGENIICQRYFRINNFNEQCVYSLELADTIRACAKAIDDELKSKTCDYLEYFAPQYFDTIEDMEKFFSNPVNVNRMRMGQGIVVKSEPTDYVWSNQNKPTKLDFKFDDGELVNEPTNEGGTLYKFAFLIDGREVCSASWEGFYPKFIRNAIDLSNKKGRIDDEDVSRLGFEEYINYRIALNRPDMVYSLIKDICSVCCLQGSNCYTLTYKYGDKVYKNKQTFWDICKLYNLSTEDGMTKLSKN